MLEVALSGGLPWTSSKPSPSRIELSDEVSNGNDEVALLGEVLIALWSESLPLTANKLQLKQHQAFRQHSS